MRILVTGASGFIGSRLVQELRAREHQVTEMVRYVSGGRFDYYDRPNQVFADLRDGDAVNLAITSVKPDVVIHLGAVSAVSYSFLHKEEVAQVNYVGTLRVAEAARACGAFLIHNSTSEVYGLPPTSYTYPVTEDQPLGATSPYAVAKVAAEQYLRYLMRVDSQPITIVRPFNTVGRALVRNHHYVVERAIHQAITQGRIELHDPRPFRDFMFRDDHVRLHTTLVDALARGQESVIAGETFNACTGESWSIEQMAMEVARVIGGFKHTEVAVDFSRMPDRPLDIPRLHGSYAKAKAVLGWIPSHNIQQALRQAAEEWWAVLVDLAPS